MEKEETKTPTWQWVAMSAISLLLVFASILMNETRNDIREVRAQTTVITARLTAVETATQLQYQAINERQAEIKTYLAQILQMQRDNQDALARHISQTRK